MHIWRTKHKEENDITKHNKYLNQTQLFYEQYEDMFLRYR